jgi:hypothetical protein
MGKYLEAAHAGRYQEAYSLLSSSDRSAKSLEAFSRPMGSDTNPLAAALGIKDTFQVTEVATEGDKAKATVEIASPDYGGAFIGLIGTIFTKALGGQLEEKDIEREISNTMKGRNLPTIKRNEYYDLVKEGDGWKVFMNYGGKQVYFDQVEVVNVQVVQGDGGGSYVSGSLRNRGDRTLREVEVTVYCLDKDGFVVHDETHRPVGAAGNAPGNAEPLKPNYARQFQYRITGAPSNWSKQVKVGVTGVEFQE